MLGNDLVLAVLDGSPVDLHPVDVLDPMFLRSLEMVVKLSIE